MRHISRVTAAVAALALLSPAVVGSSSASAVEEATTPSVVMTSPRNQDAVWEQFTITADASPATVEGAAPLKGVWFYLDTQDPGGDHTPYAFDDTAPYEVTVPVAALDADVLESRKIAVVAEDADGNVSSTPGQAGFPDASAWVTVGPPPELSWTATPPAPPEAGGSTSGGVKFEYDAHLPESVPTREFSNPHLRTVEHLVDGEVVHSYHPDGEPRAVAGTPWFVPDSVTGGVHTFTIRVTTSYRSVAEISAEALVSDGVKLTAPITSGSRDVRNGFVVTAGDALRFRVPIATKVAGTHLDHAAVEAGDQSLYYRSPFCADGSTDCPEAATLLSRLWVAPDEPGRATLSITATANGDAYARPITRDIVIQPAARLVARVSRHRVLLGRAVRVTGVLTSADTGASQAGRPIRIQWRRLGTNRWETLTTRTTNDDGRVIARLKPRRTGFYRMRSPEVRGTLGPGVSNEPKVWVRRL